MTGIQKKDIGHLGSIFKMSLQELLKNDPLRMAGATAFFTTFALPPILIILIQVLRLVMDPIFVRTELFGALSGILGPETVRQLMDVLTAVRKLAQNWIIIVFGFIFLLFVATTLFKVIKSSLNQVWKIRSVRKQGLVRTIGGRARSIAVIIIAGILFAIGMLAEGIQAFIGDYLFEYSPLLSAYFNSALNYILSVFIVTLWFAILFRYLPDAKPAWSIAFAGAFLTGILFTIGKIVLHWLLTYSNINTLYGTSASIVLLLLFVFYSSLILYFGAAFTKVWGIYKRLPIRPLPHAIHYSLIEASEDE